MAIVGSEYLTRTSTVPGYGSRGARAYERTGSVASGMCRGPDAGPCQCDVALVTGYDAGAHPGIFELWTLWHRARSKYS